MRSRLAQNPSAFGKFSAVFHLGACSSTTERNASYLIDNNTAFTRELAGWSLASGARFIYASSAATYGDGSQGMDDKDPAIERLRPLNMYGYSKHLFDLYARRLGWLNRIVGVKYFNVFGPNEDHKRVTCAPLSRRRISKSGSRARSASSRATIPSIRMAARCVISYT